MRHWMTLIGLLCLAGTANATAPSLSCRTLAKNYTALSVTYPVVPPISYGSGLARRTPFSVAGMDGSLDCNAAGDLVAFAFCLAMTAPEDAAKVAQLRLAGSAALVAAGLSVEEADAAFDDMRMQAKMQMDLIMARGERTADIAGVTSVGQAYWAQYRLVQEDVSTSDASVCFKLGAK